MSESCGPSRDLVEELFRANPTDARIAHEVPRTLGNMAITLESAGRQNEALAAHDRAPSCSERSGTRTQRSFPSRAIAPGSTRCPPES